MFTLGSRGDHRSCCLLTSEAVLWRPGARHSRARLAALRGARVCRCLIVDFSRALTPRQSPAATHPCKNTLTHAAGVSGHLCAVGTHVRMSWPLKPLKIRLQRAAISPRGVQQCVSPVHCCTNTHTQSPMCLSHIPLYSTLSLFPPCIFLATSIALYSRIYLRLNLPPGTRPRGLQPKHWRVYSPMSQGPQLHHESDIR